MSDQNKDDKFRAELEAAVLRHTGLDHVPDDIRRMMHLITAEMRTLRDLCERARIRVSIVKDEV